LVRRKGLNFKIKRRARALSGDWSFCEAMVVMCCFPNSCGRNLGVHYIHSFLAHALGNAAYRRTDLGRVPRSRAGPAWFNVEMLKRSEALFDWQRLGVGC